MFYRGEGVQLRFLIINGEVFLLDLSITEENPFLSTLNADFLTYPNWEALGALAFLEFRGDLNTVRLYVPDRILYDYKMVMKSQALSIARELYPMTSVEYHEVAEGHLERYAKTFIFERGTSGQWVPAKKGVPVERAIFASRDRPKQDASVYAERLMKISEILPDVKVSCQGGACQCGGSCGCSQESPTSNWYDEMKSQDSGDTESHEDNWYDSMKDGSSGEGFESDDDHIVDARKRYKKRQRSDSQSYRRHRKWWRKNRRRVNRNRRRKRKNPSVKRIEKRQRQLRKNKTKGRQRRPSRY